MEYLKVWVSFREDISVLNDAEKGRLFDAMLLYAACGKEPDLKGNERFVWPGAKQAIDRTARKNEIQRLNGSKGGRPRSQGSEETRYNQTKPEITQRNPIGKTQSNPTEPKETQSNPTEPKETRKEKKEVVVVDKEGEEKNEEYPFGLTDEDIRAFLETERQIEECARYVGLETSLAAMDEAKDLARQYGLDNLLAAMREAIDVHTWRYVKGILRKGGVSKRGKAESASTGDGKTGVDETGEEIRWLD